MEFSYNLKNHREKRAFKRKIGNVIEECCMKNVENFILKTDNIGS